MSRHEMNILQGSITTAHQHQCMCHVKLHIRCYECWVNVNTNKTSMWLRLRLHNNLSSEEIPFYFQFMTREGFFLLQNFDFCLCTEWNNMDMNLEEVLDRRPLETSFWILSKFNATLCIEFFWSMTSLGRYTMDLPCDSSKVYLKYIYTYEHQVYNAYHMFQVNFDMAFWWGSSSS